MTLDLTDIIGDYTLDQYSIEDIRAATFEITRVYKNLRAELIYRLESGEPFTNAPTGVYNPKAYKFLQSKLVELETVFEESELDLKSRLDKFQYILDNELPWSDNEVVDRGEVSDQLDFLSANIRTTRKRLEILEILKKYYLG